MRCYDGCPDSELKAILDRIASLEKRLKELNPNAHCTYFPVEGRFRVHEWGKPISGLHRNKEWALLEAIEKLSGIFLGYESDKEPSV